MLLSKYKYRIEHIKGTKNVVADTLSRIELLTETKDAENFDDKVANINNISDVTLDEDTTLDDDLYDRSAWVWAIFFDKPTSDNSDDEETADTDVNIDDSLEDTLNPYNVQQLQDSCPDFRVFPDYFRNGVLPSDDASAEKNCILVGKIYSTG